MTDAPTVRHWDRATPPHLVTLILIAGVSALSMNIFLPSLPDIADHFQTDYRVIQLSVATYLAFNAAIQIVLTPSRTGLAAAPWSWADWPCSWWPRSAVSSRRQLKSS